MRVCRGAGRHFHQQLALALFDFTAQGLNTLLLVIAAGDLYINWNGQWFARQLQRGKAAFQIILLEEGFDGASIGFALPFPESYFVAVGKKDVGNLELPGVVLCLLGGITGAD